MRLANKTSILLIYPPRGIAIRSIHEKLFFELEKIGYDIQKIDLENPPKYDKISFKDKIINLYKRNFRNDNQHPLIAEKNHFNNYFYNKLINFSNQNQNKFDYIFVIKPEEFSPKFLKKLSTLGNKMVGYMWDALRIFYKDDLLKSRKYFNKLYSFDKNNIEEHKDLNLKFLTNYFIEENSIIPYNERKFDAFYIGTLLDTDPNKRRDYKLNNIYQYLKGNVSFKIFIPHQNSPNLLTSNINYISKGISIEDSLKITRNTRIIIDLCKESHIGLSFRFFESIYYENKIITDNKDIVNYDFFDPNNILVVDFNNIEAYKEKLIRFQELPYNKIPLEIKNKYRLDNWIKYALDINS